MKNAILPLSSRSMAAAHAILALDEADDMTAARTLAEIVEDERAHAAQTIAALILVIQPSPKATTADLWTAIGEIRRICAEQFIAPETHAPALLASLHEAVAAYEEHRDGQPTGHLWPDPNHIFHARRAIAQAEQAQQPKA